MWKIARSAYLISASLSTEDNLIAVCLIVLSPVVAYSVDSVFYLINNRLVKRHHFQELTKWWSLGKTQSVLKQVVQMIVLY